MRWGEHETLEFIRLYLARELLWNPDHPNYKLKEKREQAYLDMISEFHSSTGVSLHPSEVRTKIKNLRATYTQEIKKILERSGPNSNYKPTLKWFTQWHNCFKNLFGGQLKDLDVVPETTEESNQGVWLEPESFNNFTQDEDNSQADPFHQENLAYTKPRVSQSTGFNCENSDGGTYKIKKRKIEPSSPTLVYAESTVRSSTDSIPENTISEDEFDIYGKFIASQLRKMDLQKALRLQVKIQNLVSEARISDIEECSD